MPDDMHKRLKNLAKAHGNSVTGLINTLVREYLESGNLVSLEKRVSDLEQEVKKLKEKK